MQSILIAVLILGGSDPLALERNITSSVVVIIPTTSPSTPAPEATERKWELSANWLCRERVQPYH